MFLNMTFYPCLLYFSTTFSLLKINGQCAIIAKANKLFSFKNKVRNITTGMTQLGTKNGYITNGPVHSFIQSVSQSVSQSVRQSVIYYFEY